MQENLTMQNIKAIILKELPSIINTDPEIHNFIIQITEKQYAKKERTEDYFDRILDDLKTDRENRDKKWEAQEKKWDAQEKKWEKNQKVIDEMLLSIKDSNSRYESTIGALGARWGIHSEVAFRKGLRSILEQTFNVKVERYEDFDYEGKVFDHPEQIEMDVIIYNGMLILCELKSSIGKSQMYTFWRKKNFYENKHKRKVDRVIVISPMVNKTAYKVAEKLGIEVYGYADDIEKNRW